MIDNISKHKKLPKLKAAINHANTLSSGFHNYSLKKIKKSNYEALKKQYAYSNEKWTDPDFPP